MNEILLAVWIYTLAEESPSGSVDHCYLPAFALRLYTPSLPSVRMLHELRIDL